MLEQEVNGEEHVLVPKDAWIKICEILYCRSRFRRCLGLDWPQDRPLKGRQHLFHLRSPGTFHKHCVALERVFLQPGG